MEEKSLDLPEECWELIFNSMDRRHQLSSLSLVCKIFLSITNNLAQTLVVLDPTALALPHLLRRFTRLRTIDLSRFRGDVDDLLSQIANSGLAIESLDVSYGKTLPIRGLRDFASKSKNLRTLNCSEIHTLQDEDLDFIAQDFPCLEELDISFPNRSQAQNYSMKPISDAGVLSLAEKLKSLRKINLSGNHFITDKSLDFLSTNCLLLSEIALYACDFVTQKGVALLIQRCVNLASLRLPRMDCIYVDSKLRDSFLRAKALCVLDFCNSIITNELLYCIAAASLPLTKLILSDCIDFSFDGILALVSKNQSIQHLGLQGVQFLSDEQMHELSRFLRSLTCIKLANCRSLTFSTFFSFIRNCPLLREIDMSGLYLSRSNSTGDDLVANRTQLERLTFHWSFSLSDECLKNITSICPDLQSLDLRHCPNITEKGVLEALKACPEIQHLGLNRCRGIKSFSLDFELSKLEVLSASRLNVDDYGLGLIGSRCPRLLNLNLRHCLSITAKGVEEMVQKCKALRKIDLKCSDNVDIDVVPRLVFSRSSLREIVPPCSFFPSESQRNFYLRHGCILHHG